METNKAVTKSGPDLLELYADEIDSACRRAVREALKKHKLAGNPIAISRNGEVILVQPDDIEIT